MEQKKFNKEPFKGIQLDMAPRDKKTVQQHEWVLDIDLPNSGIKYFECTKCPCKKRTENSRFGNYTWYFPDKTYFVTTEPTCITRHVDQEAGKNEKV